MITCLEKHFQQKPRCLHGCTGSITSKNKVRDTRLFVRFVEFEGLKWEASTAGSGQAAANRICKYAIAAKWLNPRSVQKNPSRLSGK
jgi:hypothetical protein